MKPVFLYAGQGSQHVGMGRDFYETYENFRSFVDSFDCADEVKRLMFEGPAEELSKTEKTQKCMGVFAAGITFLLQEAGITPAAACGLSLGEYGALYAAGAFCAKDYIRLLTFRGEAMAKAANGIECCMSAILGLTNSAIEEVCEEAAETSYVTVANYNCPGQTVICGTEEGILLAEAKCKERGAKRCIRLNVSGPFHTSYMAPAGEALSRYFSSIDFRSLAVPVAMNVTGSFLKEDEDLNLLLTKQVQSSVYLENDLRTLLEAGYTDYIEIGPGNVLSGFLKKTAKELKLPVTVSSIDTVADFRKVAEK